MLEQNWVSTSVKENTFNFDHLILKGDLMESDEQTIAKYVRGLRYDIANVVQLHLFCLSMMYANWL